MPGQRRSYPPKVKKTRESDGGRRAVETQTTDPVVPEKCLRMSTTIFAQDTPGVILMKIRQKINDNLLSEGKGNSLQCVAPEISILESLRHDDRGVAASR